MTVNVTCKNGLTDVFERSADHYIKHTDGSLEVVRGGTAPPETYRPGGWTAVSGDGIRERQHALLHGVIARLFSAPTAR